MESLFLVDVLGIAGVPLFVQKLLFGNAASIGKRLGMEKSLKKYL